MADETQPGATQADATQQPQAGIPPTTAPQAGTATDTTHTPDTSATDDLARLRKELEATRKEAANYRKRAQEYDAAQKAAEEAKLGELEKAQKQLADMAKVAETHRNELAAVKLENAAIKANALDSDAIVALLRGNLQFEDGKLTSDADEMVKELAKAKPHLFKPATEPTKPPVSSGGATSPGRGQQTAPRKPLSEMSRFGSGQPLFKR